MSINTKRAMLSTRSRAVRAVLTLSFVCALLWGTFWGDDDNFPFGPFRMYSTTSQLDGVVRAATLEATFSNGDTEIVPISPKHFGLRRAEIEGQLDRFIAHPELLAHLAQAHEA